MPWLDRNGRFSLLRALVFAGVVAPGLWILIEWQLGWLAPRTLNAAIHETGSWTVRLLGATLLVTPLRHAFDWSKLVAVRRMLGVSALVYALGHFSLYVADMDFNLGRVASEVAIRVYLTIGFIALVGLIALGATSTDGMVRRLGAPRWNRLHGLVHSIAVLALLHFFMQSKLNVFEATLVTGLYLTLLGHRILIRRRLALTPLRLAAIACGAAALTVALEAAWYGAATAVPVGAVLNANLLFPDMIRPAWWVLAAGLGFAAAAQVRALIRPAAGKQGRAPRAAAPAATLARSRAPAR